MLDLNAIAIFVKVAALESFSAAARHLGLPVSTVSRKVSGLEKELGVRLLERSTRKLRLTDVGSAYFQHCVRAVEEFEVANLTVSNMRADVSGTLRLSAPPNIANPILITLVGGFQKQYPEVKVKILITERHVDLIEDGVDLALRVGELKDASFVARRLVSYRPILCASPGYLRACGSPSHPADLAQHRCITWSAWFEPVVWKFQCQSDSYKVQISGQIALNDFAGIQKAVEEGLGIAEIPSIVCGGAIESGTLVEVLPEWRFAPTRLNAIYLSNRHLSRLVRLFLDFCLAEIHHVVKWQAL